MEKLFKKISSGWKIHFIIISLMTFSLPSFNSQVFASSTINDEIPPTPLPNPLSEPLPDSVDPPALIWRPALYQIPWALSPNDHFYFTRPIAANTISWPNPSYLYGSANFGENTPHTGIDVVTPEGTPVMAAAGGQVIWTGRGLFNGYYDPEDPYGVAIVIEHDFGYKGQPLYTVYAHLLESLVSRGQRVSQKDIIALSGRTGLVTAAHLHFEIRLGANSFSNTLNPELWLSPPQGYGVITGKIASTWGNYVTDQAILITNLDTGQEWWRVSYGAWKNIHSDPYYQENFILSGLPAGNYQIGIPYVNWRYKKNVYVHPGGVTHFIFNGFNGYSSQDPPQEIPISLPIPENLNQDAP